MRISVKENIRQGNNYLSNNATHLAKAAYGSPEISKKDISIARLMIASLAMGIFLNRVHSNWGQTHIPFAPRILEAMEKLDSFTTIKNVAETTSMITSFTGFSYFMGHTKSDGPFGTINGTLRGIGSQRVASFIFEKIFGKD